MTREILCGLSYSDVLAFAGMGQNAAARKLGVNHAHFNRTLHKLGMSHWFPRPRQQFTQCVSTEDIKQAASEGYTQKDAAFVLGVSERHFKRLVARWGLAHLFPNSGKASHIARRGYVGRDTE